MSEFHISGGRPLEGIVAVQGAKNSVLPILAACLLTREQVLLRHCPRLTDVSAALAILEHLGCRCRQEGDCVSVDPGGADGTDIPEPLMRSMRSSVMFLGPILARNGEVSITHPGGCELGPRPIDLHLAAMTVLGAEVTEEGGRVTCRGRLTGSEIRLRLPSVGATENAMLAAMGAEGDTVILNAAREPEIAELQKFLNTLGGRVTGAGGSVIRVEGKQTLRGGEHTVAADRIVAATVMCAVAAAGGKVRLEGADWRQVAAVSAALGGAGCYILGDGSGLTVRRDRDRPLRGTFPVCTGPYPGFPTDAQAPLMAALAAGEGCTLFTENIFDSRYRHVPELERMGADITVFGRNALVKGVPRLHGARVEAPDLRGGGALAVAALGAEGETILTGVHHIDRGYETLEELMGALGADISRDT